jgi:hypothetical protein
MLSGFDGMKVVETYLPRHSGNNDVGDAEDCRWG